MIVIQKNCIVIHHSATADGIVYRDFDAIKRGHLARGFRDIGYHWIVEKINGVLTATPGRQEWEVGAHCIPRNIDSIGICCVGNFEVDTPTDELYQFVADLCKQIMTRHNIKEIGGHKDYDATACPGRNFNVERVRQLVKGDEMLTDIKVMVKGQEINGKLINDITYVPVRVLVESLNYQVNYDAANKVVNIK